MKTNNIFKPERFISLFRQNLIHNARINLISLVAVCGGLFILMMTNQAANQFRTLDFDAFIGIFLFMFIVLGVIYAGNAFPGLRSREKSFTYLLNPASAFEKFLFELINRIVVFIILMPLIYWAVFFIEGNLMHIINPAYEFHSWWFVNHSIPTPEDFGFWARLLAVNLGLLIFFIPFTGAGAFMKVPLIKTMFSIAILVFIQVIVVYLVIKLVGSHEFGKVNQPEFLWIDSREGVIRFAAIYTLLINLALLSVTYFKMKEKEA